MNPGGWIRATMQEGQLYPTGKVGQGESFRQKGQSLIVLVKTPCRGRDSGWGWQEAGREILFRKDKENLTFHTIWEARQLTIKNEVKQKTFHWKFDQCLERM